MYIHVLKMTCSIPVPRTHITKKSSNWISKLDTNNSRQVCERLLAIVTSVAIFPECPSFCFICVAEMFSQNFKKSFTGNWNRKMEPGSDSFGRVSVYPGTRHSLNLMYMCTCAVLLQCTLQLLFESTCSLIIIDSTAGEHHATQHE